jgi:purine-binding chemotaxis protein CheW
MSHTTAAAVAAAPAVAGAVVGERQQYLSFRVGEQEYAIDILKVQEIRGQTPITVLPQTPSHVRGAMNLRGTIVPVYDVRERFGLGTSEYTRFSVIIVVAVGPRQVGLLVDAVSDVIDLAPDQLEPPPDLGVSEGYVQALGRVAERILIVLALDRVIA